MCRDDLCGSRCTHPADPPPWRPSSRCCGGPAREHPGAHAACRGPAATRRNHPAQYLHPLTASAAGRGKHISHLRSDPEHHGLLPARFNTSHVSKDGWSAKLDAIGETRRSAGRSNSSATWHHLRRLRSQSARSRHRRPERSAKQEITEMIKFLTWQRDTHLAAPPPNAHSTMDKSSPPGRPPPPDPDLHPGQEQQVNTGNQIGFRQARTTPTITQEQRLAGSRNCSPATPESLPYRVAGVLLLLYVRNNCFQDRSPRLLRSPESTARPASPWAKNPSRCRNHLGQLELPPSPLAQPAHRRRSHRHCLVVPSSRPGQHSTRNRSRAGLRMAGHQSAGLTPTPHYRRLAL